jgi:hypothetical protein
MRSLHLLLLILLMVALRVPGAAVAAAPATQPSEPANRLWPAPLVDQLGEAPGQAVADALRDFPSERPRLEVVADWVAQDGAEGPQGLRRDAVLRVLSELGPAGAALRARAEALQQAGVPTTDRRWAALYLEGCERRRQARLAPHAAKLRRVVFTRHYDLGGSHYAYTEGQSDAQNERHFVPGSSLCLLEMQGIYGTVRELLNDPGGVIRDPDVSYDGRRILFAWKKSLNEDDYHLYELSVGDGRIRQLTEGLGFADYEGAYLPNGDIIFNSTRCVQTVDCWWTEVSNLYTCDGDGRFLRRLSYDQVHTNYPTVTPDGRVIYTRWDYNDRGQIFPQGLFSMNPDGTGQTEVYGNNSWFPTTILHARAIPGNGRIVAIFTGHHTKQQGWLGLLDPARGRQENSGAQLIAPVRPTEAVRIDVYGQTGDQFQYPYPLSEREFLVTLRPAGAPRFAIYWVAADGRRELLASDPNISCNQPIPLTPRPRPHVRPSAVDYRQDTGIVYLQDIYHGPGLQGIARGTIRRLRVVALEYRAAGVGSNNNSGPAGSALVSTPVSIQGTWDVKRVLGTTPVYADGSACFVVPARTPIYFQALDRKGHAVQTMRSWTTLQPGERVSCVGCHESKNTAPPAGAASQAMRAGPQPLTPWQGEAGGFSFVREIQPILDRHCISCHHRDVPYQPYGEALAFEPERMRVVVPCEGAVWRYTTEPPASDWMQPDFDDAGWQMGPGGFGVAGTPGAVVKTPWQTPEIWLRRTFTLPSDVRPASLGFLVHHDEDVEIYVNGMLAARAAGYRVDYGVLRLDPKGAAALRKGSSTLAVHCRQTVGGQFIDVGLVDLGELAPEAAGSTAAFSLKGTQTLDPESLRRWSDSYKALANRAITNWINVQSEPSLLPPYHAGAARSRLITLLEEGHYGVRLSPAELERIACWIDLLVPYCGDYTEGLEGEPLRRYQHFLEKRRRWEAQEARNIEALLQASQRRAKR